MFVKKFLSTDTFGILSYALLPFQGLNELETLKESINIFVNILPDKITLFLSSILWYCWEAWSTY